MRFGDPEAQVLLPAIDGDFSDALMACANGTLDRAPRFTLSSTNSSASSWPRADIPARSGWAKPITGLEAADALDGVVVFHAGTKADKDRIVTAGGRVLTVVGRGASYEAMARAYAGVAVFRMMGWNSGKTLAARLLGNSDDADSTC